MIIHPLEIFISTYTDLSNNTEDSRISDHNAHYSEEWQTVPILM